MNKDNYSTLCEGDLIITGGAGFIGSHLVDRMFSLFLDKPPHVFVVDNLSNGNVSNLSRRSYDKGFTFIEGSIASSSMLATALQDTKTVFHLAAYPEVRTGFDHPEVPFEQNITNTFILLENIRKSRVQSIYFTSTSTVYGEARKIPTPEDYGPLIPISPYGASKLACEALICSYCHTYGIKSQIYRIANVVGSRSKRGIIPDLIRRLSSCSDSLELLGDGSQTKSYIHVSDCIDCILFCVSRHSQNVEIYNIGTDDQIDAMSIATIVSKAVGKEDIVFVTGQNPQNNGGGWIGDVKNMQLDISKLINLGWKPTKSSRQAVKLATQELVQEHNLRARV